MIMRIRTGEVRIYNPQLSTDKKTQSIVSYTFFYPQTKIDFHISKLDKARPDQCFIKLYGVSKDTYGILRDTSNRGFSEIQKVELLMGFDGSNNVIYSGSVSRSEYSFESGSQTLTIFIDQNNAKYSFMNKAISIANPTTLDVAMTSLSREYDYTVTYGKGIVASSLYVGRTCITGSVKTALAAILPKGYSYYINISNVHIYKDVVERGAEIILTQNTGLLSFPKKQIKYSKEGQQEVKYMIQSNIIPYIESGAIIQIPMGDTWYSMIDTGRYNKFVVGEYVTNFNNHLGMTEMECVAYGGK